MLTKIYAYITLLRVIICFSALYNNGVDIDGAICDLIARGSDNGISRPERQGLGLRYTVFYVPLSCQRDQVNFWRQIFLAT